MQSTDIPTKFQMPFGANAAGGNIRAIPVTTTDPNAASESLGWPPSTMTASGAGGVPPDGRDMNGLDHQLSAWAQWYSIGGPVFYDSVQQAAMGGYPKWSIIGSVTVPGTYWQSTAENNITNPDTAGAGWQAWPGTASIPWASPPPIGNTVPNTGAFTTLSASGAASVGSLASAAGISANGNITATGTGIINAANDLRINGVGFTQSFGAQGSQKLPSGLILSWRTWTTATGSAENIALLVSYSSSTSFQCFGTLLNSNSMSGLAIVEAKPSSNASVLVSVALWNGSTFVAGVGCDITIFTIGN